MSKMNDELLLHPPHESSLGFSPTRSPPAHGDTRGECAPLPSCFSTRGELFFLVVARKTHHRQSFKKIPPRLVLLKAPEGGSLKPQRVLLRSRASRQFERLHDTL